jgi:general secretion pathway protein F
MPVFLYRSATAEGAVAEGVIEAADEKAAVERLKRSGVIPLSVSAPRAGLKNPLGRRAPRGDLLSFSTELAALLRAGLPLDRSLNILSEVAESAGMRGIILEILKEIRGGSAFSDALQRHPKVFPRIYVSMIRAGEAGGVMEPVLEKLNEFLESSKELREHVLSAMIYPLILLATGGLSIVLLLTFVLPRFSSIFAELGGNLPLPTQILLAVSQGFQSFWWAGLLLAAGAWLWARHYVRTEQGRLRRDALALTLMGDLIRKLETARFCRTLGTLLKSGVPLLQALNNAREVIGNQVIAGCIEGVAGGAKEGKGISVPLAEANCFPRLALSMIRVGEETGQLDAMLLQVAGTYEKSLRQSVKRFVGVFEPAMILLMGLVIGFIVVSMLMAVFSMTDLPL